MTRIIHILLLATGTLGLFSGCLPRPTALAQMPSVSLPAVPVLASVLEPPLATPKTKPHLLYKLKMLTFRAQAINDSGLVCGSLTVSRTDSHTHQRYYEDGHLALWGSSKIRDLGHILETDVCIVGAINSHSEIVGSMSQKGLGDGDGPSDSDHIFVWSRGQLHDLGVSGEATAINDMGQIVGQKEWSHGKYGYQHGFLYSVGLMREIMGPANWETSEVDAINNKGQMVGNASGHACLWYKGKVMEILLPERCVLDAQYGPKINDVG